MLNILRKGFIALTIFTLLFTSMPKKEAQAGIILAPAGIGIVLLVIGIMRDDLLLIILDNQAQDQLTSKLAEKYANLSSDPKAFAGLASMITTRSNLVEVKEENVEVKFSKQEIMKALGASAANRDLVNAVYKDLR